MTSIYNVEPALVEAALEEVCQQYGLSPIRSGRETSSQLLAKLTRAPRMNAAHASSISAPQRRDQALRPQEEVESVVHGGHEHVRGVRRLPGQALRAKHRDRQLCSLQHPDVVRSVADRRHAGRP